MKHLKLFEVFNKTTHYRIYFQFTHLQMELFDYFSHQEEGKLDLKRAIKLGKQYMSKHHTGKYIPQKYIKYSHTVKLDDEFNEIETIDEA